MSLWKTAGFYTLFIFYSVVCFRAVNLTVPEPFIDEIFHVPQCQEYCKSNFSHWDSKITTPPGLYFLAITFTKIILFVSGSEFESVCTLIVFLRSLNLLGGIVVLPLTLLPLASDDFSPASIILFPVLSSYYHLFYTDVWATIFVVMSLVLVLKQPLGFKFSNWLSSILLWISLWFRQTNVLWVIFVAVFVIEHSYRAKLALRKKPSLKSTPVFTYLYGFMTEALRNLLILIPYGLVVVSFGLFVHFNGGITLGDKENHQLNLHFVQVFYCFSFITVLSWPVWFSKTSITDYISSSFGSLKRILFTAVWFFCIKFIIDNYTVVHPFLLADNRHFTFYIWRKILSKPYSFILTIPFYHFSIFTLFNSLWGNTVSIWRPRKNESLQMGPVLLLGFFAITCATIIPSPLFEPRYYILPMLVFRLFTVSRSEYLVNCQRKTIECGWYFLVASSVMTIFLVYEFNWATEAAPQRIIW